jgi:hypothetical protein
VIRHLLMELFPFVFHHPLQLVDPCFEDSYEGLLSDFVENMVDRAFQLCWSGTSYSVSFA